MNGSEKIVAGETRELWLPESKGAATPWVRIYHTPCDSQERAERVVRESRDKYPGLEHRVRRFVPEDARAPDNELLLRAMIADVAIVEPDPHRESINLYVGRPGARRKFYMAWNETLIPILTPELRAALREALGEDETNINQGEQS